MTMVEGTPGIQFYFYLLFINSLYAYFIINSIVSGKANYICFIWHLRTNASVYVDNVFGPFVKCFTIIINAADYGDEWVLLTMACIRAHVMLYYALIIAIKETQPNGLKIEYHTHYALNRRSHLFSLASAGYVIVSGSRSLHIRECSYSVLDITADQLLMSTLNWGGLFCCRWKRKRPVRFGVSLMDFLQLWLVIMH